MTFEVGDKVMYKNNPTRDRLGVGIIIQANEGSLRIFYPKHFGLGHPVHQFTKDQIIMQGLFHNHAAYDLELIETQKKKFARWLERNNL